MSNRKPNAPQPGTAASIELVNGTVIPGVIVAGPFEENGFAWFKPATELGGETTPLFLPLDKIRLE